MLLDSFLTGLYFRFIEENKSVEKNLKKEAKLLKERELVWRAPDRKFISDISKYENFIYARNIPARDVSGDYFDVISVGKYEYYIYFSRRTGKGVI